MVESSAFELMALLATERHTCDLLTKLGRQKFGDPTPEQLARLAAIEDLARLDRLAIRLLKVDTWDALLRGR